MQGELPEVACNSPWPSAAGGAIGPLSQLATARLWSLSALSLSVAVGVAVRRYSVRRIKFTRVNRTLVLFAAFLLIAPVAGAQVPDSGLAGLRRAVAATTPDSVRPPVSARRAFLSSFLLPGYGQTRLERRSE